MAAKKKSGSLFRIEEKGATADGKGKIYHGFVNGKDIGAVVSKTQAAARKSLLRIARARLGK